MQNTPKNTPVDAVVKTFCDFRQTAAALCLVVASGIACAAPFSPPPKVFNDLNVTMQTRACGELMADLALSGVYAVRTQFPDSEAPLTYRKPVYAVSSAAIVLLSKAGQLTLSDRLRAGKVAAAIKKMSPQDHVTTANFCQRRIVAWLKAGEIGQELLNQADLQAQQLMDKAFTAKVPPNLR